MFRAFTQRPRRRAILLALFLVARAGTGYFLCQRSREDPRLAGVPLRERMKDLHSSDPVTRRRAIYTLAAFGPKAKGALPELLKILTDRRDQPWEAAAVAIGRMREAAFPSLERTTRASP
jgi:hypothetical protein